MPFDPQADFFVADALPPYNPNNNTGPMRMVAQQADPQFYVCVDKRGNQLPVWQVMDGVNKGGGTFWAYWCPYDQDRYGWTTLGSGAAYVFTATMDGCSFGIGHAASDGTVIVGHVNSTRLQAPTGDTTAMEQDQRRMLRMMLQSGPGGKKRPTIFEPDNYRYRKKVREVSATTFGVRENGKWRFYAHRWVKTSPGFQVVYEYLGTTRIK